jgi:hypothetical protein
VADPLEKKKQEYVYPHMVVMTVTLRNVDTYDYLSKELNKIDINISTVDLILLWRLPSIMET